MSADAPDRGATFVEMLVSIVLIGTVGVAVLAALAASTRGAAIHRDISDAQAWLATTGDAVMEAESYYRDCVSQPDPAVIASEYEANIVNPLTSATPGAPTVSVIEVQFWDSTGPGWGTSCRYAYSSSQDDRLQRITLETTVDGETRRLSVVKRPDLPATVNTAAPPTTLGGGNVIPSPTPGL